VSNQNRFPPGWDENRVRGVIKHYDSLTEDEAIAEDDAAFAQSSNAAMEIPLDLVPAVRDLIAKHKRSA
jgi:hypothetical protein